MKRPLIERLQSIPGKIDDRELEARRIGENREILLSLFEYEALGTTWEVCARRASGDRHFLAAWRDWHSDQPALVVGCGPSARDRRAERMIASLPTETVVIVVNDALRYAGRANYCVMVDDPRGFVGKPDRLEWILRTIAGPEGVPVFTPRWEWEDDYDAAFRIHWRRKQNARIEDWRSGTTMVNSISSMFPAVGIAAFLGCRPIGMIGMDLTSDHALGRRMEIESLNADFADLEKSLRNRGHLLYNLSDQSKLTTVPRGTIREGRMEALKDAASSGAEAAGH